MKFWFVKPLRNDFTLKTHCTMNQLTWVTVSYPLYFFYNNESNFPVTITLSPIFNNLFPFPPPPPPPPPPQSNRAKHVISSEF